MKPFGKFILLFTMIAVCIGLFVLVYFFMQKNATSQTNQLKRKAKKEYLASTYTEAAATYKHLIDSLKIQNDAASMNYANAIFLSLSGKNRPNDSTRQKALDTSLSEYAKLFSSSSNHVIASLASNQTGFVTLKGNDIFSKSPASIDSALSLSLVHFKNALIKDPQNEPARYNYELIKKIAGYSETIIAQTKALVAQRKYQEAATLLENAMKRDRRLAQQKELLDRIQTIIGINTGQN